MKDNEVAGIGNSLDFGARIYDSRLTRFSSLDPLAAKFPWQSSYAFAGNSPIKFIDKNGKLQVDKGIASSYPLLYKYLSTQIEADVMNSTTIKNAFKSISPNITDQNIRNVFSPNSGPVLTASDAPGGAYAKEAAGHLTYFQDGNSEMEINNKLFEYTEGQLKSSDPKVRQAALTLFFMEVIHESGHEALGLKGTGKNGEDIRMNQAEYKMTNDQSAEPGYQLEYEIWKTPVDDLGYKGKPDVVEGVHPNNPKNKVGVVDRAIENASQTDEGKKTLPTVPQQ